MYIHILSIFLRNVTWPHKIYYTVICPRILYLNSRYRLTLVAWFCRFYFPTYENDRLLYCLEEETDASDDKEKGSTDSVIESIEEVTDAVVIAEDMNIEEAMNRRDYIMKELRSWRLVWLLNKLSVICLLPMHFTWRVYSVKCIVLC